MDSVSRVQVVDHVNNLLVLGFVKIGEWRFGWIQFWKNELKTKQLGLTLWQLQAELASNLENIFGSLSKLVRLVADDGALTCRIAREERFNIVRYVLQLITWLINVTCGSNHLVDVLRRHKSRLLVLEHI